MKFDGVAAIVVGGASGLGAATALRLIGEGAKVIILDRDEAAGQAFAKANACHFELADVTDAASVSRALDGAEEICGKARILVNCAGIGPPQKLIERSGNPVDIESFRRIIDVNLVGTVCVLSQFAARLARCDVIGEERGVIVNTASVAAFDGQIGQAAYAASKAGIAGMTLPIAREFARIAIRVVTIAPGIFMTPLLANLPGEVLDSLGKQVPFPPRLGDPDEFAMLAIQVVANPMLNGETIRLDGAIRMAPR